MDDDYREDWEEFPDDWYDCSGEMMLRAYKILLENCFSKPSADTNNKFKP